MRRISRAEAGSAATNRRAHLTLAVVLILCAVLFVFELSRALSGNALSWAYVFEWPLLGAFSIYMWWRLSNPVAPRESVTPAELAPQIQTMHQAWINSQRDRPGVNDDAAI